MTPRTTALAIIIPSVLIGAGCEQSSSPDRVSMPENDSNQEQSHDGHAHQGDHDHPTTEAAATNAPADSVAPDAIRISASDFTFTLPEGWEKRPPSNSMRLFELAVPAVGDAPAPIAAFSLAGGPIDANITRWQGQFAEADATRSRETLELAGTTVHTVEMSGTFRGMGGPARDGTVMRAAIVERPGQPNLFIKMTGQAEPMDASKAAWDALLASMTSP